MMTVVDFLSESGRRHSREVSIPIYTLKGYFDILKDFSIITCLSNLRYVLGFDAKLGNSS